MNCHFPTQVITPLNVGDLEMCTSTSGLFAGASCFKTCSPRIEAADKSICPRMGACIFKLSVAFWPVGQLWE